MLFTWVITTPAMLLSFSMMITSTILTMAATNWISIWMMMELNLLSFIPLMLKEKSFMETEAAIKYFLAQALGSAAMLLNSMSLWYNYSTHIEIILLLALLLKMGAAPCHFWYPSAMTAMPWITAFYLSTWQKLAPLVVLSFMASSSMHNMMLSLTSINAILGGIMGMNQTHIRTMMAYSSIGHMGWMIALISINKPQLTMLYFTMYTLISMPVFTMMVAMNVDNTSLIMNNQMSHKLFALSIPLLMLSLGGIPPLTGFLPKLLAIMALANTAPITLIILIVGSLMNLYFYLSLAFSVMTTFTKTSLTANFSNSGCQGYKSNLVMSTTTLGLIPLLL